MRVLAGAAVFVLSVSSAIAEPARPTLMVHRIDVDMTTSPALVNSHILYLNPCKPNGCHLKVGNTDSTLARKADVVLDASVDKEACPLNLAPTTSTTVALAIGDAIAMAIMESRGLTAEEFAANHPAGRLGKRLTMKVSDLMHESPNIAPDASWLEVVKAISKFSLGAVNVVNGAGSLAGIVTDGDLRRTIERTGSDGLADLTAEQMMTAGPITASQEMLAYDALQLMENRPSQISVLPVVDGNGVCVGLLRLHDIVRSGL